MYQIIWLNHDLELDIINSTDTVRIHHHKKNHQQQTNQLKV